MNYNDTYNKRYDKIKDTVAFKNKNVTTLYQGSTTPAAEEGLTIAKYMSDSQTTMKHFLHYVNRLNSIASINGINTSHMFNTNVTLAMAWWSYIKMPGRELPENSVWQVE
jgi:hypothetical protein